jgi:hypothetical protein
MRGEAKNKGTFIIALLMILSATAAFSADLPKLPQNLGTGSGEAFDSARFQSAIRSNKSLGALAKEHSTFGEQTTSYGFAAKSEEAKFFIIGSLYSEALAYLKSGNSGEAAKRLEAIENEFINLNVPASLYNYINKTRNIIETKRYSPEAQAEFLSLFQPFYEDYAKSKSEDKLTLFRAGSWLMDMSLAAAGGDKDLIKQPGKLDYFIKEMKRMDAPKGVLDALDEISKVATKKEVTDKDAENVLKQVKKIQTVLG